MVADVVAGWAGGTAVVAEAEFGAVSGIEGALLGIEIGVETGGDDDRAVLTGLCAGPPDVALPDVAALLIDG